jgi:hypothetical protein
VGFTARHLVGVGSAAVVSAAVAAAPGGVVDAAVVVVVQGGGVGAVVPHVLAAVLVDVADTVAAFVGVDTDGLVAEQAVVSNGIVSASEWGRACVEWALCMLLRAPSLR